MSQAESLLAPFHFDAVIADKGYDSDPLRELLAAQQVEVVIPFRRNRKQPRDYDRIRYRERNIVERFINRIKWYRRIFTRYEKLARRFMAFLHFASTLFWLEQNVNEPTNSKERKRIVSYDLNQDLVCSKDKVIAKPVFDEHSCTFWARKCPVCGEQVPNSRIYGLISEENEFLEYARAAATLKRALGAAGAETNALMMPGFDQGFPFAPFHTIRMYPNLQK